jgi:glutathione peroxidase
MSEKVEVNGEGRHEVYRQLVETPDVKGEAGDVRWNFEKFLVDGEGTVVARFEPLVDPLDQQLTARIESLLA